MNSSMLPTRSRDNCKSCSRVWSSLPRVPYRLSISHDRLDGAGDAPAARFQRLYRCLCLSFSLYICRWHMYLCICLGLCTFTRAYTNTYAQENTPTCTHDRCNTQVPAPCHRFRVTVRTRSPSTTWMNSSPSCLRLSRFRLVVM